MKDATLRRILIQMKKALAPPRLKKNGDARASCVPKGFFHCEKNCRIWFVKLSQTNEEKST